MHSAESKKPRQNRVKSRKNDFVEKYLLNILRSCVLLLQFLKIFLFWTGVREVLRSVLLEIIG